MLKKYFVMSLLMFTVCNAESAEILTTPNNLRIEADKHLSKCTKAATQHTPIGNQLLSDGLSSCYAGAKSIITENIARAAAKIAQSKEANCQQLYSEADEKWVTYAEEVANLPSLAEAPLNTDDDLELVLLSHRYDIAYAIAGNVACKN